MNLLEKRSGAYFDRKKPLFVLLTLCSIAGIVFSFTVTAAILAHFAEFIGIGSITVYILAGIWEGLKALTAHMFFSDFYRKKIALDLITLAFFLVTWAGAIGAGFSSSHRLIKIKEAAILDSTTTTPHPTPAPPSDVIGKPRTGATAAELKTHREQSRAITAAAAIQLKQMHADSTRTALKIALEKNKGESFPYLFLIIDSLVLLSIAGAVHIAKHQDGEEATTENAETDEQIKARFVTARSRGDMEKMQEYEAELQKRGAAIPQKKAKTTPPAETPIVKINSQRGQNP